MPNSLTDLNNFSDDQIPYEDQRPYTANVSTAANATVTLTENEPHFLPVGVTVNQLSSLPGNVTMTVDFTGSANITNSTPYIGWANTTFPANITYSEISSNVFQITGFIDKPAFDAYGSPEIVVFEQESNYYYTANLVFPNVANTSNNDTRSWQVDVTVNNLAGGLSAPANVTWNEDAGNITVGNAAPQITDAYDGPLNYTLTITGSSGNVIRVITESGTANSTYDSSNVRMTMVDTKSKINDSLGNITIVPRADADQNFNLVYQLTAPISGATSSRTQYFPVGNTHNEYSLTTAYTYDEDSATTLLFQILDQAANMTYTSQITQNNPDPAQQPGRFRVDGTFQDPGLSWVETGNRATINARTIEYFPPADYAANVTLTYTQVRHDPVEGDITQANAVPMTLAIANTHSEVSITTTYTYDEDSSVTMVFDIIDTDSQANTYQVQFNQISGNTGYWFLDGVQTSTGNITITDTKANINAANVSWVPYPDATSNVEIYYSQSKTTTGNVTVQQVTNTLISMSLANSHNDYTLTTSYNYTPFDIVDFVFDITDTDIRANTYSLTFDQTSGTSGRFLVDGVDQGVGNTVTVTGNRTAVNATSVQFSPDPNSSGTVQISYQQQKTSTLGPTVTQASETITLQDISSIYPVFELAVGYALTENQPGQITYAIANAAADTDYTVTFSPTADMAGNTTLNTLLGRVNGQYYTVTPSYFDPDALSPLPVGEPPFYFVGNLAVTGNLATVNTANISVRNAIGNTETFNMTAAAWANSTLWGNNQIANATVSFTITPNPAATFTTSYSVDDGEPVPLVYTISDDPDVRILSNVAVSQISVLGGLPAPAFTTWANIDGVVYKNPTPNLPGPSGAWPDSNTISDYNQQQWQIWSEPQGGSSNVTIPVAALTQLVYYPRGLSNTVVTTANLTINYANTLPDYSVTTPTTYDQDRITDQFYQILDQDPGEVGFTVNWTQTDPDPAVYPGRWIQYDTAGNVANIANSFTRNGVTGNVIGSTLSVGNIATWAYSPPLGYTGNITLAVNQWKMYGNVLQQATDVNVDMSVSNTNTVISNVANVSYNDNNTTYAWGNTVVDFQDQLGEWGLKLYVEPATNSMNMTGDFAWRIQNTWVGNTTATYSGTRLATANLVTYANVAVDTVTGGGRGGLVTVDVYPGAAGTYSTGNINVRVSSGCGQTGADPCEGAEYKRGDVIRILGNTIGGTTPDNDLTVTMTGNIAGDTMWIYPGEPGVFYADPNYQYANTANTSAAVILENLIGNIGFYRQPAGSPAGYAPLTDGTTTLNLTVEAYPRGGGLTGNIVIGTANVSITNT